MYNDRDSQISPSLLFRKLEPKGRRPVAAPLVIADWCSSLYFTFVQESIVNAQTLTSTFKAI